MKLAFYLRLSLADGDLGKNNKDESNSIENQRLILQNFVESMDVLDGDVTEYVDDGHTERTLTVRHFRQWWRMLNVER